MVSLAVGVLSGSGIFHLVPHVSYFNLLIYKCFTPDSDYNPVSPCNIINISEFMRIMDLILLVDMITSSHDLSKKKYRTRKRFCILMLGIDGSAMC